MAIDWASPSKENLNFARLCRLLIYGGTRVLKHVFGSIHSPSTLHTVLHSAPVYTLLRHLRAKRVLSVHQWDELYPITTRVTSGIFDNTLLVVLLHNICSLTPPATGWDKPPAASDLSKEADLARINLYRNEVYGHITQTAVSDADFEKLWTEISAVLIRVIGSHYQPDIDRLKVRETDLEEEKDLIKMLKEWEEIERSIKRAIKDSEQRVMEKSKELGAAIKDRAAEGDTVSNVQSPKDQPPEKDDLSSRAQGFVEKRQLPDKKETSNEMWTLIAGLLGRKKDEKLMDQLIEIIKPRQTHDRYKLLMLHCLYEYRDDELSKRVINKLHDKYCNSNGKIDFSVVRDIDCLAIRYLLYIVKLLTNEQTRKHPTSTQSFIVNALHIYGSLSPSAVTILCKSLVNIPTVTELLMGACRLDDECITMIAQTLNNTKITNLDLKGIGYITDKGVMYLCSEVRKENCRVEKLTLSGGKLDDRCVKIIAQTLSNTKITHLNLASNSNITATGITDICAVLSDCRVEELKLSLCKLDDECVKIIAQTLINTRITHLDLSANYDITDEGVMCLCDVVRKRDCLVKVLKLSSDKITDQCKESVKHLVKQNKPDVTINFIPSSSGDQEIKQETGRKTLRFTGSRLTSEFYDYDESLENESVSYNPSPFRILSLDRALWPRPDSKPLPVKSTSTVRGLMKESPAATSASDQQTVSLDFEGGFHDLSPLGVLLEVPPNAVACPTNVTCRKLNPDYSPAPAKDDETLVSYVIEFTPTSLKLQKPIIVTLMHCGPSKKEGYETLVKELKHRKISKEWEQIKEIPVDSSFAHQHFKSRYIQVKVRQLTTVAVVSRLIRDTFKVTASGCVVRSSVCDDVTLEFPKGAVDQTFYGTMKLYCIPDHTEILDDITAFPCPLIVIDGFEGITFNLPVKIRLPHPYPAGYPSGDVRVLCMEAPHEWKDITDQVHCIEHESFLELEVKHFSGLWAWICEVSLHVASSLSHYLSKHPQHVCFAVFKENPPNAASLRMPLVCVPNRPTEQFNSTDAIKDVEEEGRYTRLVKNTSNKPMRPNDKAYIKVEGCYKLGEEEDFFLQLIENDVCRKELLLRKSSEEESRSQSREKLVIFFLERKDGDVKENLCKISIDEMEILSEVTTEETVELEVASRGPSGNAVCRELVSIADVQDLLTIDATTAADKVADYLQLNKLSMEDPPDDVTEKCRAFCLQLKELGRYDIIKELRKTLPSGMTGPLLGDNTLYKRLDPIKKTDLTRALCGDDLWKCLASVLGVPSGHVGYYGRQPNPAEAMLEDKNYRKLTVGELYDKLVLCGAAGLADTYL